MKEILYPAKIVFVNILFHDEEKSEKIQSNVKSSNNVKLKFNIKCNKIPGDVENEISPMPGDKRI